MMKIQHITLNTGHSRRSSPKEVDPEVRNQSIKLINNAVSGEFVPITPWRKTNSYWMNATRSGETILFTIWNPDKSLPICTVGVATDSRDSCMLWELLHDTFIHPFPLVTNRTQCPRTPWVAARLEVGVLLHPEAMTWLGDLERCLAWSWVQRSRTTSA